MRQGVAAFDRRHGHPGLEYPLIGIALEFLERISIARMLEHQQRFSVTLIARDPRKEDLVLARLIGQRENLGLEINSEAVASGRYLLFPSIEIERDLAFTDFIVLCVRQADNTDRRKYQDCKKRNEFQLRTLSL